MKKTWFALAGIAALLLSGCTSTPAESPSSPPATKEAAEQTEPTVPEAQAFGTPDNPWPVGDPVPVGDWEITINSWIPNANDMVSAAGDDLSMLEPGQQYALLNVTMTWNGSGPGDISLVSMQYEPAGGDTISSAWSAFGTTPGDNKLTYQELASGGSVTGDMLYSVDAGNSDGLFMLGSASAETIQYAAVK